MYKWQQVRSLRTKGESIKGIARRLKLSRNTVRKYLKSSDPPKFKARQYKRMLDGYGSLIGGCLQKRYIGTRIYEELLKEGYKGSLSTVHRHISGIKKEEEISNKRTTRVETAPGKQMQYDWTEWNLTLDGKPLKIYLHEVVLSYSRKKFYTYSLSINTQDVIRAIADAIEYFGGVVEELLIDNPKQMVITHKRNGIVRYNDEFLCFCGLYGIEPNPCQNYRARTKGKVEKPFYYIEEHLLRGLEVGDLSEFDRLLMEFTDRYNTRPHSTLKESPDKRYLKEKGYLKEIPFVEPTILFKPDIRKVSNDGYISWDGLLYPVPMRLCLREVLVESIFGRLIRVYDNRGEKVAEYEIRLNGKGVRPEHPEHEKINRGFRERREENRSKVVRRFVELFKDKGKIYLDGLKDRVSNNVYWHLEEIMGYTELYGVGEVSDVISECIRIGAYHKNSVKRLLSLREIKAPSIEPILNINIFPSANITRDLSPLQGGGVP